MRPPRFIPCPRGLFHAPEVYPSVKACSSALACSPLSRSIPHHRGLHLVLEVRSFLGPEGGLLRVKGLMGECSFFIYCNQAVEALTPLGLYLRSIGSLNSENSPVVSFTVGTPAPISLRSRPNMFSQFLSNYPECHWKQILRYRLVFLMTVNDEPYLLPASVHPFSLPVVAQYHTLLRN